MNIIKMTKELENSITWWKVVGKESGKMIQINKNQAATPEEAAKIARKTIKEPLKISGLTMHAETKPFIIE